MCLQNIKQEDGINASVFCAKAQSLLTLMGFEP
jgi:hypothetical protein